MKQFFTSMPRPALQKFNICHSHPYSVYVYVGKQATRFQWPCFLDRYYDFSLQLPMGVPWPSLPPGKNLPNTLTTLTSCNSCCHFLLFRILVGIKFTKPYGRTHLPSMSSTLKWQPFWSPGIPGRRTADSASALEVDLLFVNIHLRQFILWNSSTLGTTMHHLNIPEPVFFGLHTLSHLRSALKNSKCVLFDFSISFARIQLYVEKATQKSNGMHGPKTLEHAISKTKSQAKLPFHLSVQSLKKQSDPSHPFNCWHLALAQHINLATQ